MMPRKKLFSSSSKGIPIVRFTFCLSMLIAACSLFTPFPALIIKAWKGESISEPTASPTPTPSTSTAQDARPDTIHGGEPGIVTPPSTPAPSPQAPVVSPPPTRPNMVDVRTITPWKFEQAVIMPAVQYPPFPPVMPPQPAKGALWNVTELTRGLNLKTQVNFTDGGLASDDRKVLSNYRATLSIDISVPEPMTKTAQLASLNPHIKRMLPDLDKLFSAAKVSPFYGKIIALKQNEVRRNMASLNKILDRHNFYDTQTILEMKHPGTGRKVLWLQADMDVVSDGSDGDRLSKMPDSILKSSYYQPSTSYRWKKATANPNPLLAVWEKRLSDAKAELSKAKAADKPPINSRIDYAQRVITELKTYSFLIAEYDPFIVIPLGVVNQGSAYSPSFGDYVVVVAGNKLYPAIVGDAGPRYKTGEASLRMAKTINPKASSYSRPVSDLTVSYIIFPGSADETKGAPNYADWKDKCQKLIDEIGGMAPGYSLHEWEDLLAPPPPPPSVTDPLNPTPPPVDPSASSPGDTVPAGYPIPAPSTGGSTSTRP